MAEIDKNKFNLSYLVAGEGLKDWWKSWGAGIRLAVTIIIIYLLIMGGITLWNKLFPKPLINENKPTINVGQGGTSNYTVIQNKEKNWSAGPIGGAIKMPHEDELGWFGGFSIQYRW